MIRYVYIIGVRDNPVKVGIADNVERRLAELQIGCPDRLTVHHAAAFAADVVQAIETGSHQALAEHHRHGEWFNVTVGQARDVIERVSSRVLIERPAWRDRFSILGRISQVEALSQWAPAALAEYVRAGPEESARLDRVIGDKASALALRAVLSDPRALDGALFFRPGAHRKASLTLARAINALSADYSGRRCDDLLSEIEAA